MRLRYQVKALPSTRRTLAEGSRLRSPSAWRSPCNGHGHGHCSGRDLCVVLVNEFCEDGRIFTMSVSVVDSKLPAVKGRVRADLKVRGRARDGAAADARALEARSHTVRYLAGWGPQLNGWYLEPLPGGKKGARVVYMTEIDLNGMIPGAILKLVALQVPLAIADVRKYLTRFGPPAFVHRIGYACNSHEDCGTGVLTCVP